MAMIIPDLSGLSRGIQQAGGALGEALQRAGEYRFKEKQLEAQKGLPLDQEMELINAGFTPEEIALYRNAPVGGRTAIIKDILEKRLRGTQPSTTQEITEQPLKSNIEVAREEIQNQKEANNLLKSVDIGLTPAERIRREDKRYTANQPFYNDLQKSIKNTADESRRIAVMDKLNNSDKLPKGIGRLNVDSLGNLRFPFLSSREAQKYQKLMNEFVSNARDSFGARVTNFEVDIFLKRLPTLWNSKEGRQSVLQQMKIVNEINNLHNQGTSEGIKKAGGIRKIDYDQAKEYALKKNESKINQLEKEYRELENNIENITSKNTEKKSLANILG